MAEFVPQVPAQPDKATYQATELQLSPRLTRDIYQKMFNEQAPAYDPARRIKRWFFTNTVSGSTDQSGVMVEFKVFDDKTGKFETIAMTAKEAATPNLPGTVVYEKYVNPTATVAQLQVINALGQVMLAGQTGMNLVEPMLLQSVVDEAAAQLSIALVVEESTVPSPFKLVYGSETRRKMNVVLPSGQKIDGPSFVANRFAKGIFAPGKWSLNSDNQPVFTPDVPVDGEQDVRPEVSIPVRSLLPNEKVESRLDFAAGLIYYIARTDVSDPTPTPSTGGGLTAEQAAALTRIDASVTKIAKFLGTEG
ncbi:MAG: hypothetical protein ABFD89_16970 [Bryobacteraceae bacterium]